MILLIDNYDSFSYNLVQFLGELSKGDIKVVRNDEVTIDEIRAMKPSHIVLSPGPGKPDDAGICKDVVRSLKGEIPILGVCLGHQSICEVFGYEVTYAGELMHGKKSNIKIEKESKLFDGIEDGFEAARYHSLAAYKSKDANGLVVTARDMKDNEIMAVEHVEYPIFGLQFHPESVLTPKGKEILNNFLNI